MEHLDTQVLEQWARGELPPEEAGACELHTARCAPCAQAHARVRAGLAAAPAEPDTLAPGAPAPAPPLPPLLCGTAIGRFLVLEKRGQGGFGEVYAAYDPTLDRRVALKLLRPGADARGQRHLLREAQTMARLSHPNLLPVFDAGEHAGRVFIAMELVEGTTVARWLRAAARPWREVVRVFVEAGRGLAAAHAAGVVHRDFKPDNALITPAGRVVVMDFGLARAHAHAPPPPPPGGTPDAAASAATAGEPSARGPGLVGTPGYAAPEQIRHETPDARADVFGLCASLYLGLYGHKPFFGLNTRAVLDATLAGTVEAPPRGTRVPAWLHRVLLQGLEADPARRFPSMDALLAALQRDPAVRRRRALALGAGALLLVAGVALPRHLAARRAAACEADTRGFATAWSPARREAVGRAFRATGLPYAEAALGAAARGLDAYAARWAGQRAAACRAAHLEGTVSASELALRTACLDARREEAAALVDALAGADARAVEHASTAVSRLPALDACADTAGLLRAVPPPDSPALAAQVAELRSALTAARATASAGRTADALARVSPLAPRAAALGYAPLEAEALAALGELQQEFGQHAEAEGTLRRALAVAEGCNHDAVKAQAVASLVWLYADDAGRGREARAWLDWAFALARRVPASDLGLAHLHYRAGWLLVRADRPADAEVELRRAVDLATAAGGPGSADAVRFTSALGVALTNLGKLDAAQALYEELTATQEPVLGRDHPRIGVLQANLARVHAARGEWARALAAGERARAVLHAAWSPRHPNVARVQALLAEPLWRLGRPAEALAALDAAARGIEAALGARAPELSGTLQTAALVLAEEGRLDEAQARAERAQALARELPGDGEAATLAGGTLGQVLLARGRAAPALPLLEAAAARLAARGGRAGPARELAHLRFLAARAAWEAGHHRADALVAARDALAALQDAPGAGPLLPPARAWLAARTATATPRAP